MKNIVLCFSLISEQDFLNKREFIINNYQIAHLNNYMKTNNDQTFK